jgi:NAD(P)-dependent dehydrogenase (short-subunit alcohol dehydrogenase family)
MTAIVSGASSGIGLATAKRFLAEGYKTVGVDIAPAAVKDQNYRHVVCDVRDAAGLPKDLPEPEIIISCAGTLEERDAIDVNLKGAIGFAEHFLASPCLRSVLFIASASARNGAEFPLYSASKAGLVGYMKNLALRLAARGVTVNSISPGGVITPANAHILESPELYGRVLAETLLGKWAEPEEIAELAYFMTVTNRSMTGEDLLIDNGEMLKSNFIW